MSYGFRGLIDSWFDRLIFLLWTFLYLIDGRKKVAGNFAIIRGATWII